MLQDDWEELDAQIEAHGPLAVVFYLQNSGPQPDELLELDIDEIKFEDGLVKVMMT